MTKVISLIMLAFLSLSAQEAKMPQLNMTETLKNMSKQKDSSYSNFMLGVIYLNGDENTKKDIEKSKEYFMKDAEKLSYANYMLGFIQSMEAKNNSDYEVAIKYFKKASELKAVDSKEVKPVALAAIGNVYLNMMKEPKKALPYLIKASKLKSMPNVDFAIALIYYTSKAPLRNEELAEIYLNKAYSKADDKLKSMINTYLQNPSEIKDESCSKNL